VAQKPDGKAAKTERVTFTRPAAERIAKVVRQVESGDRKGAALTFGARVSGGGGAKLQLGTFTGSWATATYKVVTLAGSTNTASVLNACNPVAEAACERTVVFSTVRGTQVAVELQYRPTCATCHISIQGFDLSSLPGYIGNEIQILGHNSSACLTWYSIHQCE
jgi:hypothetical protein